MFYKVAVLSYFIDRLFGEFTGDRHPVIYMGAYIKWFESRFYRDSVVRGATLTISLISLVFVFSHIVTLYIEYMENIYIKTTLYSIIGSTTISTKMLHDSVKDIIQNPQNIRYLVSRDTKDMSLSDRYKSAIESYAENLSDGVIAPMLYLALFGIDGAFIYKGVNTLDSMVGYRTLKYEKFGKVSAILDDILNYIPARVTALLIALFMGSGEAFLKFYRFGREHDSPNGGLPISAMAISIGVKLGGDTHYFGKLKKKPYFGDGRLEIKKEDILQALSFTYKMDTLMVVLLIYYLSI
jgi:adenosylcobinamide-phosphate synthase